MSGTKQLLDQHGPNHVAQWVRQQDDVLITDTTFRDAHQSLLATRVRTKDLMNIASKQLKSLKIVFHLKCGVAQPLMLHIISLKKPMGAIRTSS